MKFFFDRNLSVHLARMIGNFDRANTIVHQDDDGRFQHDSEDLHIIGTIGNEQPRPVWITADIAQRRVPEERAALRDSAMTIFFFKRNNGEIHYQALKMIAVWPAIIETMARTKQPTAYEVPAGRIGMKLMNQKIDRLCFTAELFKGERPIAARHRPAQSREAPKP